MTVVLVLLALAVAFFGFQQATEATFGVFLVGVACLLGICARLWQAQEHYISLRDEAKATTAETDDKAEAGQGENKA